MSETDVHPTYQHRHTDEDGLSVIVAEGELGPLVRRGRPLVFGYWRPHAFNPLASMTLGQAGAFLQGIQGERWVAAELYDGDPDVLLSEWLKHAEGARAMDMRDREAGLRDRAAREAAYQTRRISGGVVGDDPLTVRMAVQSREDLVNGTWADGALTREVATLTWSDDMTVTLKSVDRNLLFRAPVDLDSLAGAWLDFAASARQDADFRDIIGKARAARIAE